jgi:serine/threonine-protein kinase HipA
MHSGAPELQDLSTRGLDPDIIDVIDLSDSVENEHFCLTVLERFGLPVARTDIATFGARRVLVLERFDRLSRGDRLLRSPQEDFCRALSALRAGNVNATPVPGRPPS